MVFIVLLPKTLTSVEAQSLLTVETQSLLNRFPAMSFLGGPWPETGRLASARGLILKHRRVSCSGRRGSRPWLGSRHCSRARLCLQSEAKIAAPARPWRRRGLPSHPLLQIIMREAKYPAHKRCDQGGTADNAAKGAACEGQRFGQPACLRAQRPQHDRQSGRVGPPKDRGDCEDFAILRKAN